MSKNLLITDINRIIFDKYFTTYEKIKFLTINKEIHGIIKTQMQIQPYIEFLTEVYEFLYQHTIFLLVQDKISHCYIASSQKKYYLRISGNKLTLDDFIYILLKDRMVVVSFTQTLTSYMDSQDIKNMVVEIKKIQKKIFQPMNAKNKQRMRKKIKVAYHKHNNFQTDIIMWRGW